MVLASCVNNSKAIDKAGSGYYISMLCSLLSYRAYTKNTISRRLL